MTGVQTCALPICQERVNLLIARLAEAGRTEDLIRSATDPEYQEQLFREFGLFPQCDW